MNKISVQGILQNRPSKKPEGAASYKMDVDKRLNTLALNRIKAACEATQGFNKTDFKLPNNKNQSPFSINLSPGEATIPEDLKKLGKGCKWLFKVLNTFKEHLDKEETPIITAQNMQFIRKEIHNLFTIN